MSKFLSSHNPDQGPFLDAHRQSADGTHRTNNRFSDDTRLIGRMIFGFCAYGLWIGLLLILDRIGLPIQISFVLSMFFCLAGMLLLGIVVRTMRIDAFYTLNRQLRGWHASLFIAALSLALIAPAAIEGGGWNLPQQALALGIGLLIFGLLTAPFLRQTAALTPIDVMMARFPHTALRVLLIGASAISALMMAAAGFDLGMQWLNALIPIERTSLSILVAVVMAICFTAGGQRAIIWIGLALFVLILVPVLAPLPLSYTHIDQIPLPWTGDGSLWTKAIDLMQQWPNSQQQSWHTPALCLLALGLSAFMPLQMAALSTISTTHARQSGVMAAVWSVIPVLGLAIAVATTSLSLQRQTLDRRPSDVAAIVYQASANHLISMCGRYPASPALATAACNSDGQHALLSAQDVRPTPLGLILGQTLTLPALLALSALVYAGLSALALMLSASCLMNWAIVLSQDGLARLYEKDALASRRLALTRMMFMIGLMVIIIGAHWWALSAQQMMAAAFALNTSLYLPLFALALMWRPTAKEALISSFTALLIFAAVFADNGMPQNWDEWARATAWAGLGAFILAGLISLRQPNSARATGKAFVYAIRHGHSDVYSRRHEA